MGARRVGDNELYTRETFEWMKKTESVNCTLNLIWGEGNFWRKIFKLCICLPSCFMVKSCSSFSRPEKFMQQRFLQNFHLNSSRLGSLDNFQFDVPVRVEGILMWKEIIILSKKDLVRKGNYGCTNVLPNRTDIWL